jgi:hypothetical protein
MNKNIKELMQYKGKSSIGNESKLKEYELIIKWMMLHDRKKKKWEGRGWQKKLVRLPIYESKATLLGRRLENERKRKLRVWYREMYKGYMINVIKAEGQEQDKNKLLNMIRAQKEELINRTLNLKGIEIENNIIKDSFNSRIRDLGPKYRNNVESKRQWKRTSLERKELNIKKRQAKINKVINNMKLENIKEGHLKEIESRKVSNKLLLPSYYFPSRFIFNKMPSQTKHWLSSFYSFTGKEGTALILLDRIATNLIRRFFAVDGIRHKLLWKVSLRRNYKYWAIISNVRSLNRIIRVSTMSKRTRDTSIKTFFHPNILKAKWLKEGVKSTGIVRRYISKRRVKVFGEYEPIKKVKIKKGRRKKIWLAKPILKHTPYNVVIDLFLYNNKRYKIYKLRNMLLRRISYKYMYSMYADMYKKINETINRPRIFYINIIEPKVYNYYREVISLYGQWLFVNTQEVIIAACLYYIKVSESYKNKLQTILSWNKNKLTVSNLNKYLNTEEDKRIEKLYNNTLKKIGLDEIFNKWKKKVEWFKKLTVIKKVQIKKRPYKSNSNINDEVKSTRMKPKVWKKKIERMQALFSEAQKAEREKKWLKGTGENIGNTVEGSKVKKKPQRVRIFGQKKISYVNYRKTHLKHGKRGKFSDPKLWKEKLKSFHSYTKQLKLSDDANKKKYIWYQQKDFEKETVNNNNPQFFSKKFKENVRNDKKSRYIYPEFTPKYYEKYGKQGKSNIIKQNKKYDNIKSLKVGDDKWKKKLQDQINVPNIKEQENKSMLSKNLTSSLSLNELNNYKKNKIKSQKLIVKDINILPTEKSIDSHNNIIDKFTDTYTYFYIPYYRMKKVEDNNLNNKSFKVYQENNKKLLNSKNIDFENDDDIEEDSPIKDYNLYNENVTNKFIINLLNKKKKNYNKYSNEKLIKYLSDLKSINLFNNYNNSTDINNESSLSIADKKRRKNWLKKKNTLRLTNPKLELLKPQVINQPLRSSYVRSILNDPSGQGVKSNKKLILDNKMSKELNNSKVNVLNESVVFNIINNSDNKETKEINRKIKQINNVKLVWDKLEQSFISMLSAMMKGKDKIEWGYGSISINSMYNKGKNMLIYSNLWESIYSMNYMKKEYRMIARDTLLPKVWEETREKEFNLDKAKASQLYDYKKNEWILWKNLNFLKKYSEEEKLLFIAEYNRNKNNNKWEEDRIYSDNIFTPYYRSIIRILILEEYKLAITFNWRNDWFYDMLVLFKGKVKAIDNHQSMLIQFITVKFFLRLIEDNYRSIIRIKPKYYFLSKIRYYGTKFKKLNLNSWSNSIKYVKKLRKTPNKFWKRHHELASRFYAYILKSGELDTKVKVLVPFVIHIEDLLYNIYGKWAIIRLWPLKRYYLSSYILVNKLMKLILWRKKNISIKGGFEKKANYFLTLIKYIQIKRGYNYYKNAKVRWPSALMDIVSEKSKRRFLTYKNLEAEYKKRERFFYNTTHVLTRNKLSNNILDNWYFKITQHNRKVYKNYKVSSNDVENNITRPKKIRAKQMNRWLRPFTKYLHRLTLEHDMNSIRILLAGRTGYKRNNERKSYVMKFFGNVRNPRYKIGEIYEKKFRNFGIPTLRGNMKSHYDYSKAIDKNISGALSLKIWISSKISVDIQELLMYLVDIKYMYSLIFNRYYAIPKDIRYKTRGNIRLYYYKWINRKQL